MEFIVTFISSSKLFLFVRLVFLLTLTCAGLAAASIMLSIMLSQSMPETTPDTLIDAMKI